MRLIFLFVAIALAAGAFLLTMNLTKKPEDTASLPVTEPKVVVKEVPTVDVYVARQEIPIGSIVERPMLDIQPWPTHLLLPDFVQVGDPNAPAPIEKMVVRTPFQKGEVIMQSKMANPKDPSFLAAAMPKGMRAVTITSDPVGGVAGFVFPGDRVDVLITHQVGVPGVTDTTDGRAALGEPVTEVLLSNVRVLAINQKATAHGAEGPQMPSSVTLEVTQADAQRLRLTEAGNGKLSLTLRPLKDKDSIELARPTGVGDLSRITPPAYFPFLYDKKNDYSAQVVNLFEPDGTTKTSPSETGTALNMQQQAPLANSPLANSTNPAINQFSAGAGAGKAVIVMIRGLTKTAEEVEGQ